ncbi:MAG: pyruvate kinase [Aestuariivirga sp.]|uniref:pyruvate kinase n=1 Tax=Aestuariivirga sp. TaxID=2650926 RepID=UPI0025C3A3FC|nr:pyruvate kinase [Aestuariivirga sp.]MCA3559689.1 pyruvate kinase [Aestuariivirga sp.]
MQQHPPATTPEEEARAVLSELADIHSRVLSEGRAMMEGWQPAIKRTEFLPSAENLAHYLAFRRFNIRPLQERLSQLGLSSLGRSEAHVLASLQAVLATLSAIAASWPVDRPNPRRFSEGAALLEKRQSDILGRDPDGPRTRIMVTLPAEAAEDRSIAFRVIAAGADVARINCAHDSAEAWSAMIAHVREAAATLNRDVRILMDLGGPKIRIGEVNEAAAAGRLFRGDRFVLCDRLQTKRGVAEATLCPPVLLDVMAPGHTVWINDGKIGARVAGVEGRRATLEVFSARDKGERLKPEKGVNLPGVELPVAALTGEDIANLDFVASHADIVGYSFVQRPSDVTQLLAELEARRGGRALPALMLKIETPLAVKNLPRLIVQAAAETPVAVMIARGDLAVEIGLERLPEIQEEILWLCEAAHVPVVWATQVLDSMVKDGAATRAEATDAAMGQRAECVMLNKGPFLAEAVTFLDGVLRRMDRHQIKKTPQLSALNSWREPQTLG